MKRFIFSLVLAAAALLGICAGLIARTADLVLAGYRKVKAAALDAFQLAANEPRVLERPLLAFVSARAFVLRIAKRERPVLTNSWRACPST